MHFIFRPGTLGDQIILQEVMRKLDLKNETFILIEHQYKSRLNASSFKFFFNIFSEIYTYENISSLISLMYMLRKRYGRQNLIYLPHSGKKSIRLLIDLTLFSLAFSINFRGVWQFNKMRWGSRIVIPEYDRIFRVLSKSLKLKGFSAVVTHECVGRKSKRKIIIAPCSAWPSKDWGEGNFRRLTELLVDFGAEVHIVGGNSDPINRYCPKNLTNKIKLHGGRDLTYIQELMCDASAFIGVDSALSHIAGSLRLPSIILYSDTNRKEDWKPLAEGTIGIKHYVKCGGCFSPQCLNSTHDCMSGISVEHVFNAYKKLASMGN